jgi:hypothetical protein
LRNGMTTEYGVATAPALSAVPPERGASVDEDESLRRYGPRPSAADLERQSQGDGDVLAEYYGS